MKASRNTFAEKANQYASARPGYPDALYEWIRSHCTRHDVAWDCASGNGQAALGLSPHFGKVFATDISSEQIAHGVTAPNVEYSVQSAERTSFPDASVDAITVAQALHWFDYGRFWPEVVRVARPGALFCAWGYDWFTTSVPEIDQQLVVPFREIILPFWSKNNALLWAGYRKDDIEFPFEPLTVPAMFIEVRWSVSQTLDYMKTWSAFKRSASDPQASAALEKLIVDTGNIVPPEHLLAIRMPLKTIAGRVVGAESSPGAPQVVDVARSGDSS